MRASSRCAARLAFASLCLLPAAALASEPGAQSRQAQAYRDYSLAQQSLLRRDYASALDFMERAASQDDAPDLLLELAQLRFSLNDLDRAQALAQQIVADHPEIADARQLLGDIDVSRARDGRDPEANIARAAEHYRAALDANPADRDACQSLAELYYQTGRLEEAGTLLRTFSKAQLLDPALSLLLGKIDVRLGRFEEAEDILLRIVERAPASAEGADALAALYEYQQKYDKAIAVYTALLKTVQPTAYLQDRVGSLLLRGGHAKEAVAALEEGQRLDPNDSAGLLTLVQAYDAAGDDASALSSCDRLVAREPGNLEARFHRAHLEQKGGESSQALAGYRAIIDLATGRGALTDRESSVLALTYSQIGLIEMDSRHFDAAAEAFGHALDRSGDPGPELFALLGRARLDGGKPSEAQTVTAEAARRFPDDLDLKVLQGEVLIARGEVPKAREYFRTLLADQGGSPEAYAHVSEALLRQKRFGEAESVLKEGTRLHPGDDGLLFARGAAVERLGKVGEAERFLAKAIRLNPKNAMALNYLGYMLADRGLRLKDSIGYVERALLLDPKNPAYLDSLGWAQFRMALYGPAEKNLRDALRYDQGDPTIREHLGDLLMATGRAKEAIEEWEAALSNGHDEPDRVRGKIEKARAVLKVSK